jgi:hypothetical protein
MTKQSGLGDNLYLAGYDISNDTGGLSRIGGGLGATQDVTGIDKSAYERIGLGRDGSIEYAGFLNTAAGHAHVVQRSLPRTDVAVTYARGTAVGDAGAFMIAKQVNYDFTRATDGALTTAVQCVSNGYGLMWGGQLTGGLDTDLADANGAGVDFAAGTAFGLTAMLQVIDIVGADATITIEESSDDAGGDAYATIASFAQVTADHVAERINITGNVERWLRVATTGTFTSLTYNVTVAKHTTAVVF